MGLKIYNQRPQSEFITGLHLTPMAHVKTCAASLGGGGLAAESVYLLFNTIATPVIFVGGLTAIAFLGTVDFIEDRMIDRAMKNGDVKVKSHRRSKINL